MPFITQAVFWIVSHWKTWIVPVVIAVAGTVTWISNQRKNRAERLLAEANRQKLQQDQEIQSLAEIIIVWTDNEKRRLSNTNLIFSDETLRELLRGDADRLHIATNYLVERKRAKRPAPGYWQIDPPQD